MSKQAEIMKTIVFYGLEQIKENLNEMSKTLCSFRRNTSSFAMDYIIEDELKDLIEDPIGHIEDMVGYGEDLAQEPIIDLTPLQRALAFLYLDREVNVRKSIEGILRMQIKSSKEFRTLAE
jgi:hypothetical protein